VDTAPINRTFVTVAGVADVDTYDSGVFPSRGVGLRVVSEWSGAFSHQLGDARGYLPLGRRVSLWAGATVGASGGTPPPHYLFYLGGANSYDLFPDRTISFAGLYVQERRGRHVQKAELGAQWQVSVAPALFARVRWNTGTGLGERRRRRAGRQDGGRPRQPEPVGHRPLDADRRARSRLSLLSYPCSIRSRAGSTWVSPSTRTWMLPFTEMCALTRS
jgi:hypothetical protein